MGFGSALGTMLGMDPPGGKYQAPSQESYAPPPSMLPAPSTALTTPTTQSPTMPQGTMISPLLQQNQSDVKESAPGLQTDENKANKGSGMSIGV